MSQPLSSVQSADRVCPVCGAMGIAPLWAKGDLQLVRCKGCSMVFSSEPPAEFRQGKFYETTGSAFYASDEKLAGDYSPVRYRREIRLLRRFCRAGRVLDVGCSTGGFLFHLRQAFPGDYQVCGTDVASGALDLAEKHGVPVRRGNFFDFEAGDEPFDAITFWAVLEHVDEPARFLRQAHRLLAPGGVCLTLVPNLRSLAVRLLGPKYRYILPQHLNYFSAGTLAQLVTGCGFDVIHSATTHFNPIVILQDFRARERTVSDQERARLLVKTNALKSNPLLRPAQWGYSALERILGAAGLADNVVIVARKSTERAGQRG